MLPSLTHSGSCSTRTRGVARRQLAPELPVRGRPAAVQQPGLGEQEGADTHRAEPPHLARHLLQPRGERRVTHRSGAQPADQEHGVARALDPVEVMPGHERQHAALALDRQTLRVGDDLDRVDRPARKAIDRVEHLERSDQIELVDRRHDHDDDPTGRLWRHCGHASTHYAAARKRFASVLPFTLG